MTRSRFVFETTHEYHPAVRVSQAVVHLKPQDVVGQTLHDAQLTVTPAPDMLISGIDMFGNPTSWVSIEQPHHKCTYVVALDVSAEASTEAPTGAAVGVGDDRSWEHARESARISDRLDVRWCRLASPFASCRDADLDDAVGAIGGFDSVFAPDKPLVEVHRALVSWIRNVIDVDSDPSLVASIDSVLTTGRGDAIGIAHLAIALCRSRRLSARYVHGFLQTVSAVSGLEGPAAIVPHGWLSVWDGTQWVDLDPSSMGNSAHKYLQIAVGRDYGDAAPVRAVALGAPHATVVSQRVLSSPVQISAPKS